MLSQFFRSARGITKSSTKQEGEKTLSTTTPKQASEPVANPKMVTTRGQSGRSGVSEVDEWDISTPSAQLRKEALRTKTPIPSARKRRLDEVSASKQDTVSASPDSASKKQKKLPLRNRDAEHSEVHTHLAVEIPVGEFNPLEYTKVLDTEEELEPTQSTQSTQSAVPRDTPSKKPTRGKSVQSKAKGQSAAVKESPKSNVIQAYSESDRDSSEGGAVSEDEVVEEPSKKPTPGKKQTPKKSPKSTATAKTAAKSQSGPEPVTKKPTVHKRFGSEEAPDPVLLELAKTVGQKPEVEETGSEEEDSDDDAPEVVETQAAQEAAQSRAREVARAAEE